ncbi:MAG TPA: rhodanese-like domain-containing protein [Caldithrix abyssi]|uniref:Rhodanese-like domain-containing protein n=1 Tax=Caldithrix abyssi TaxID=187145 RepID=A0A7V1LLI1_CALAY|nr:rhodanese-like domain-containing protein [Caldithrix abyssi]
MKVSSRNLGFGILLLLGLILAFSPVDQMNVSKVADRELLLSQLHSQSNYIEAEDVAHWIIDKEPGITIIDIRSAEDFKKYHIPGAINIPLEKLLDKESLELMEGSETLILASNGNTKASQAWLFLKEKGYDDVYVLHGGMNYWVQVFSAPQKPVEPYTDDEIFRYQFRLAAGPVMMGTVRAASNTTETPVKPRPVKRKRRSLKKKVDEGC